MLLDFLVPLDSLLYYCGSVYGTLLIFVFCSIRNQFAFVLFLAFVSVLNLFHSNKDTFHKLDYVYFKNSYYERENDNISLRQLLKEIEQNDGIDLCVFSESIFSKRLNQSKILQDYRISAIQRVLKNNQITVLGFNVNDTPVIVSISEKSAQIIQRKEIFIPHIEIKVNNLDDILNYAKSKIFTKSLPIHKIKNSKFSIIICFEACFSFRVNKEVDFIIQFSEESFFNGGLSYGKFLFERQTLIRSKETRKPIFKVSNMKM